MQQICEDFDIVMNAEQFQYQNRKDIHYFTLSGKSSTKGMLGVNVSTIYLFK